MDIKAEMAKVADRMDQLRFELFEMENRKGDLVSELLKLQGQMELLKRLDGSGGKENAGPNP